MRLREWREINRLSLSEIARRVGVANAKVVWRWEAGELIPRRGPMIGLYVLTVGAVTPNDFYDLPPLPESREAAA